MGEMFVAGAEKTEFPGFGILRQAKTAACGDEHGSRRIRTDHGGWNEDGRVYTVLEPGAKMEILLKKTLRLFPVRRPCR